MAADAFLVASAALVHFQMALQDPVDLAKFNATAPPAHVNLRVVRFITAVYHLLGRLQF